jgi:hypothetical protein
MREQLIMLFELVYSVHAKCKGEGKYSVLLSCIFLSLLHMLTVDLFQHSEVLDGGGNHSGVIL